MNALPIKVTSTGVTLTASVATKIVFTTNPPTSITNGAIITSFKISEQDVSGNVLTSDSATTVTAAVSTGGVLSGTPTVTLVNGVATFSNLILTGSVLPSPYYTLTFSESLTGISPIATPTLTLGIGAITQYVFTAPPVSTTATGGSIGTVTIALEDSGNNVVTSNSSLVVTAASSAGSTLGGTKTATMVKGVATFTSLTLTGSNNTTYALTFSAPAYTALSANVTIVTGTANKLAITTAPPASNPAGAALSSAVVVTVQDAGGNTLTSSSAVITVTSSTGSSLLSGSTTSVTAVNGVATFSYLLLSGKSATNYTLTFASTGLTSVTSGNIGITVGAATKLAVTTAPTASVASGTSIGTPKVTVQDSGGNTVTTATPSIGIAVNSGSLTPVTSVSAVSGIATFTGYTYAGLIGSHTLTFSSASLASATATFTVTVGAAVKLGVTVQPASSVNNGGAFGPVSVAIQDSGGNTVTTNTSTVTMGVTKDGALGGVLVVAAKAGIAAFTGNILNGFVASSPYQLTFSDGTLTPVNSNTIALSASTAPTQLGIVSQPPSSATNGVSFGPILVAVQDFNGNTVSGDTSTVTVQASYGGTIIGQRSVAASGGVATFSSLTLNGLILYSPYTLTFSDGSLAPATSTNINLLVGSPTQLVVTTPGTALLASGQSLATLAVSVEDVGGNVVSTDGSTITVTSTGGAVITINDLGTLGASSDLGNGSFSQVALNGVATFSDLVLAGLPGSYGLGFTDSAGTVSATAQSNIAIYGAATHLAVTNQPLTSVQSGFGIGSVTVAAEDANNNVVVSDTSTVTLSASVGASISSAGTPALTCTLVSGQCTLNDLVLSGPTGSSYVVNFTDPEFVGGSQQLLVYSSNPVILTGAPAQLALSPMPTFSTPIINGSPLGVLTIQVQDAQGFLVGSDQSSVTVSVSGGGFLGGTDTTAPVSNGVATFTNLSLAGIVGTNYTLTFNDGALTPATLNNLTLSVSTANTLAVLSLPTQVINGPSGAGTGLGTVTVAVEDAGGNIIGADTSVVSVSVSSGAVLGGTTSVQAVNGVATFTDLTLTGVAAPLGTTYTLTFVDSPLAPATPTVTLLPGTPTHLVFASNPATAIVDGASLGTFVLNIEDASNNIVNDTNQISFTATSSTGSGRLTGGTTSTVSAVQGVATFSGVTLTGLLTNNPYTLTFSYAAGSLPKVTKSVTLSLGLPSQLVVTTQPTASIVDGTAMGSVVVKIEDVGGNVVSGTTKVTVAVNNGGVLGGTSAAGVNAVAGVATFTNLTLTGLTTNSPYTLTFSDTALSPAPTPGLSSGVSVTIAGPAKLVISVPPAATLTNGGTLSDISVQITDVGGNLITGDTSKVTISATASSGTPTLGAASLTVAALGGVALFSGLTLTGLGAVQLVFTDTDGVIVLSGAATTVTLSASTATQIVLTAPAAAVTDGGTIGTVTVKIEDAQGNVVTTDSSLVTLSLAAPGNATATLAGSALSKAAVNGVATFTGLTLTGKAANTTYQIVATDSPYAPQTSASFGLSNAAVSKLVITSQPVTTVGSGGSLGTIVVSFEDVGGNLINAPAPGGILRPNYTITASVKSTVAGPTAALSITTVNVTTGSPTATITPTLTGSAGTYIFTVTGFTCSGGFGCTALPLTAATAPTNITLTGGTATKVILPAASSYWTSAVNSVSAPSITLEVADAQNNASVSASANMTVALVGTGAALSGTLSIPVVSGYATFSDLKVTGIIGSYQLKFTYSTFTLTSSAFTLTPGSAVSLKLSTTPSTSVVDGASIGPVALQVLDVSGNVVVGDTSTVTVNVSGATLGGTTTAVVGTVTSGYANFVGGTLTGLVSGSPYTLTFIDGSLTSTTAPVSITLGAPSKLVLTTAPATSILSGNSLGTVVVAVQDVGGNVVTSDSSSVNVSVSTTSGASADKPVLGGAGTYTLSQGQVTITDLTLSGTGPGSPYTLTFSDTADGLSNSLSQVSLTNSSSKLKITAPSTPSATVVANGATLPTFTVAVEDLDGYVVGSDVSTVTVSISPGTTINGTTTVSVVNGVATFSGLSVVGTAGSYTLLFTDSTSSVSTDSALLTLNPGLATHLVLTSSASLNATNGVALSGGPTLTLEDSGNNAVLNSSDTITVGASSPSIALTGTTSVSVSSAGTVDFSGLILTGPAGTYTLTFSDKNGVSVATLSVTVGSTTGSKLVVTNTPSSSAGSGLALGTQPTLAIEDVGGNVDTSVSGTITVSIAGGPSVTNGSSATVTNGVASLSGLTITGTASLTPYVVTFSFTPTGSGSVTFTTTMNLTLGAGTPTSFTFTTTPSSSSGSGAALLSQPVISVTDATGNPILNPSETLSVSIVGGPTLTGQLVNLSSGAASFSALTVTGTAASYTLLFTDSVTGTVVLTAPLTLNPGLATHLVLTSSASLNATNGVALSGGPTLTLEDSGNNAVLNSSDTITVGASSPSIALTGTTSVSVSSAGTVDFSGLILTGPAGTYTLTFSDKNGVSVATLSVTVGSTTGSKLVVTNTPSSSAGSGLALGTQPTLAIEDVGGNVDTSVSGTITVSIAGGPSVTNGSSATVTNGVASLSGLTITGTASLTPYVVTFSFTPTGSGSVTFTTTMNLTLGAGTPTKYVITNAASTTANNAQLLAVEPIVQVQDAQGNLVTTVSGTMTVTALPAVSLAGSSVTFSGGVATFSALKLTGTASATPYVLSFGVSGSGIATVPLSVTLSPGTPTQLLVLTAPSSAMISALAIAVQPVLTLKDVSGNVVTGATGNVTVAVTTGGGTVSAGATATVVNGLATFSGLCVTGTNGSYVLTFSYGTPAITVVSSAINLTGAPAKLVVITNPVSTTPIGGALGPMVVNVEDASGAVVLADSSTMTVSASSANAVGTLGGASPSVTTVNGVATFSGLTLTGLTANNPYLVTFTDGALSVIDTAYPINLTAGTAVQLQGILPNALVTAVANGAPFPMTNAIAVPLIEVAIEDLGGNPVTTDTSSVTMSLMKGQTPVTGVLSATALTVVAANGIATFSNVTMVGLVSGGPYTLTFTDGALIKFSIGILFSPGAPAKLVIVTQPGATSAVDGLALNAQPQVQVTDSGGNPVPALAGTTITASLATSAGVSTLNATPVTPNASGLATFSGLSVTGVVGSYSLSFASATTTPALTSVTSNAFTLTIGAPSKLTVTTQPGTTTAQNGIALSPQPVVSVCDIGGNVESSISSGSVTAAFAASPTANSGFTNTLSLVGGGAVTAAISNGVATFSGLTITGATGNYTLVFSSTTLTTATSNAFTLTYGVPASLAITTQPGTTTAQNGVALSPQPVVKVLDSGGNVVLNATGSVGAAIATGPSSGSLTNFSVSLSGGVATFASLTITGTTGTYTLTFATSGLASTYSVTSANVVVTAGAPSQLVATVGGSSTAQSGAALAVQPSFTIKDASGNVVVSATGTVTASIKSTSGSGSVTPSLQNSTANIVNGVATFVNFAITGPVGNYVLTFTTSGITPQLSIDSSSITLSAGAANALVLTPGYSSTATNGSALSAQPSFSIVDSGGNVVSVTGTVTATLASTPGTNSGFTNSVSVSANAATASVSGGSASFSGLTITGKAGSYTLTFTFSGGGVTLATSAVTSSSITLSAGAANALVLTPGYSSTATNGSALSAQPSFSIVDSGGNVVSVTGTVTATLASTPGTNSGFTNSVSVSANAATASVSGGSASFSGLTITGKAGSYTLTFTFSGGGVTLATSAVTSSSITLSAGAANALVLVAGSTTTPTSGVAFTSPPQIRMIDTGGNAVASSDSISIAIAPAPTSTVSATPLNLVNGAVTFTGLTINGLAGQYVLTFSDATLSLSIQLTVQLQAGAANRLTFTNAGTLPSAVQNGSVLSPAPILVVADASGNANTSATGTVNVVVTTGSCLLSGVSSVALNGSGVATFSNLAVVGKLGTSCTLTFSDTTSGIQVATMTVTISSVGPATQIVFSNSPSTSAANGQVLASQPIAVLEDSGGNVVTGSGSISAAITNFVAASGAGTGSTVLANSTASVGGAGASFSGLGITGPVGTYTLTFTQSPLTPVTLVLTLSAGAPTKLVQTNVATQSTSTASGVAMSVAPSYSLQDQSGNLVAVNDALSVIVTPSASVSGSPTALSNGVVTLSGLLITGAVGTYSIAVTDTTSSLSAATTTVQLTPAVATKLVLTNALTQSTSVASGATMAVAPSFSLEDPSGNVISANDAIVVSISPTATLSGAPTALVNGVVTLTSLTIAGAAGSYTITVRDSVNSFTATATISISAGAATKLALSNTPGSSFANGAAFGATAPTFSLEDAANNVVSAADSVTVTISPTATLTGTPTVLANGTVSLSTLVVTGKAGTYSIQVTDSTKSFSAGTFSFTLTAGAATKLVAATAPQSIANTGAVLAPQPVINIVDSGGNIVTTATGTVSVTAPAAVTLAGNGPITSVGGVVTFSALSLTGAAAAYTLTFAYSLGGVTAYTVTVTVTTGATKLVITTAPSTTAASAAALAVQPVIKTETSAGAVVSTTGTITATIAPSGSNTGTATISLGSTATLSAGVATFTALTITGTAGTYTLTFTNGSSGMTVATAPVTLGAGAATHLAVITPPAGAVNGVALTTQPVVAVEDSANNIVTTATGTITASSANATVAGTTTATVTSGRATFVGLIVNGLAGTVTVSYADSVAGVTTTTSSIALTAGAPSKLVITTAPAGAVNGAALTTQPVVKVEDVGGNVIATSTNTITATVSTGSVSAGSTATAVGGVATFSGLTLIGLTGARTLTFTDSTTTTITAVTSASISMTVGAATKLVITTLPTTTDASGAALATQPRVSVEDSGGNVVTTATGTVTVALVGTGSLTTTTATITAGVATFSGLGINALVGTTYALTFTSGTLTGATSANISVTVGAAKALALRTAPAKTATSGTSFAPQPVVIVVDSGGNVVTTATGTVTVTITAGTGGTIASNTATITAGVATFTALKITRTAGSATAYTISFADSVAGITAVTAVVTV